jgi:hypothetical protein
LSRGKIVALTASSLGVVIRSSDFASVIQAMKIWCINIRSRAGLLCCLFAALAGAPLSAHGQHFDDALALDRSLQAYAVTVINTRGAERWSNNGVYLGRGAVLTAAHVVGRWHDQHVRFAGHELAAKIVKQGSSDTIDLAVLSVDEEQLPLRLRLRRNPICKEPLRTGQAVVVAVPEATARARILPPGLILPQLRARFGTIINDVPLASSGSGVFDAAKRCLLGIVSRKTQRLDVRKEDQSAGSMLLEYARYFVPAATIANFIPQGFRF